MKHYIFILLGIFTIFLNSATAQSTSRSKLGMYILPPIPNEAKEVIDFKMTVPPVFLESSRQLLPVLSLGSEIGLAKFDFSSTDNFDRAFDDRSFKASVWTFNASVKAIAHTTVAEIVEIYGTAGVGYTYGLFSSNLSELADPEAKGFASQFDNMSFSGMFKYLTVGANVYLGENFGVFGELGVEKSKGIFKIGIVFKR